MQGPPCPRQGVQAVPESAPALPRSLTSCSAPSAGDTRPHSCSTPGTTPTSCGSGLQQAPDGAPLPPTPCLLSHWGPAQPPAEPQSALCATQRDSTEPHIPFLLDLTKDKTTASFSRPWKPSTDLISSSGYLWARLCLSRSTWNTRKPCSQLGSGRGGLDTQQRASHCSTVPAAVSQLSELTQQHTDWSDGAPHPSTTLTPQSHGPQMPRWVVPVTQEGWRPSHRPHSILLRLHQAHRHGERKHEKPWKERSWQVLPLTRRGQGSCSGHSNQLRGRGWSQTHKILS